MMVKYGEDGDEGGWDGLHSVLIWHDEDSAPRPSLEPAHSLTLEQIPMKYSY